MAKVTGPLMSMTASGTVGKTATFSIWKGNPYVRSRIIPKNPKSDLQKAARAALGTIAKACAAVLTIFMDTAQPPTGSQFWVDAVAAAPAGQSWISYLQATMNQQFPAIVTAYGLLTTVAGYYQTTALTLGLADYVDKNGTTQKAGEQLYILAKYAVQQLAYTGFAAGVDSATQQQCTEFGAYVHDTIS